MTYETEQNEVAFSTEYQGKPIIIRPKKTSPLIYILIIGIILKITKII